MKGSKTLLPDMQLFATARRRPDGTWTGAHDTGASLVPLVCHARMRTPATAGAPDRVGRWLGEQLDPLLGGELRDRAVMLAILIAGNALRSSVPSATPPVVATATCTLQTLRVEVGLDGELAGEEQPVCAGHRPDPIVAGLASRWGADGRDRRRIWFELLFGDAAPHAA
jgi:hypothetical protein